MRRKAFVFTLVVFVAAIAVPMRAHADDGTDRWTLQDDQGLLTTDFGSSQTVYVTGIPKNQGLIPSTDVYVVPNQNWSKRDGQILHDISNPSGTPNTVVGFEVVQQPIYLPYLRVGQYDIVFDYDENGRYDASLDDVLGVDSRPGFTVHYDGDGLSIDKTRLKNELAAPFAATARAAVGLYATVMTVKLAAGAYDAVHLAAGIGPVVAGEASPVPFFVNLTADAEWQVLDPLGQGQDIATDGMAKAVGDLYKSAAGIEADPPDPHYKKVAQPVLPPYSYDEFGSDPVFSSFAAVANRAGAVAAYQLALRHAMERLDGAAAADDLQYVALQAQAIADDSASLVDLYPQFSDAVQRVKSQLSKFGIDLSLSDSDRALYTTMRTRVAANGFDATEMNAFEGAGLDTTQIARFRAWLTGITGTALKKDGRRDTSALANVGAAAHLAAFDANVQAENLAGSINPSTRPRAIRLRVS